MLRVGDLHATFQVFSSGKGSYDDSERIAEVSPPLTVLDNKQELPSEDLLSFHHPDLYRLFVSILLVDWYVLAALVCHIHHFGGRLVYRHHQGRSFIVGTTYKLALVWRNDVFQYT